MSTVEDSRDDIKKPSAPYLRRSFCTEDCVTEYPSIAIGEFHRWLAEGSLPL
jgi:hypothetical protein